jgi:hypothetical protein
MKKGININEIEIKNMLYADDATFVTDGSRESFETLIAIFDGYNNIPFLKFN